MPLIPVNSFHHPYTFDRRDFEGDKKRSRSLKYETFFNSVLTHITVLFISKTVMNKGNVLIGIQFAAFMP